MKKYKVSMQDLLEFGLHLPNDGKIPLLNLNNLEKPVDESKISIPDLLYLERNYTKIKKKKFRITDLIPKNTPQEKILPEPLTELLCDNPQCRLPINGDYIAFSEKYKEVYHPGDCITYAIAMKAFNSREIVIGQVEYINREKALKIKSGLEKKAE